MDTNSDKLRTEAAAGYVGLPPQTLAKMRVRGDGPPFSKTGKRVVVYDVRDLEVLAEGSSPDVNPGRPSEINFIEV